MKKRYKIPLIVFTTMAVFYFGLIIYRIPHYFNKKKTDKAVEKIHNTKLTMDDVIGNNLPPDPGDEADKTIQGIDANQNGIRDDVELAIFKEYPNSAKTRSVLLQYALALQMEVRQEVVNGETVTEVATEQSRADTCLADTLVPRKTLESDRDDAEMEKIDIFINFVKNKQLNTEIRKKTRKVFYKNKLGSYSESTNEICDMNYENIRD